MAATRLTHEEFCAARSDVQQACFLIPQLAAEEARRTAPPEHAEEHARRVFNEMRRAGWDQFVRICDYIEWLENQVAKKGAGR